VAFRDGGVVDIPCFLDGAPEKRTTSKASVPPDQRLLGVHTFVVDDSESALELLRTALEYSGAFVTTASGVSEGKNVLREVRPHVLVSDIGMPHDGFEIVRDLMSFVTEAKLVIPAVAISGGQNDRDHLREAGFAAFIPKPLDPFELASVVAKLAQERGKR